MSTLLAPRSLFLAMALASAGLMAFALYLEHVYLLDPCPLCMMQRIWVVIVGVLALGAPCTAGPYALGPGDGRGSDDRQRLLPPPALASEPPGR